jgi:hypothetical protein
MRKAHLLISGAWLLQAVAWFLPATKGFMDGLVDPVPGWQAFLFATSAFRLFGGGFDKWYAAVLAAISVITTLLFIFGSPWVVWRGSRPTRRVAAWIAAAAFVVNVHWYILTRSESPVLGIGYFLWWWSFALLTIGLFDLARQTAPGVSAPQPI